MLYNVEVHCSSNTVRVIKCRRLRWQGHVARRGEIRNAFKILTGNTTGRTVIERPRSGWEANIKMDIKYIGVSVTSWIVLAQDKDYWSSCVSGIESPDLTSYVINNNNNNNIHLFYIVKLR